MKKIPLTQNKFALIDDKDFEKVNALKWHVSTLGYAIHSISKSKKISMHCFIKPNKKGFVIDHKNMNRLDNRRSNLIRCAFSNNLKRKSVYKNNKLGLKGVTISFIKNNGEKRYAAMIKVDKKQLFLGYFKDMIIAAKAYNKAAIKYFGIFAELNKF